MPITKQQLSKMKEAPLQTDILIPLFRAMGYKDVTLYQGSGELGKDVVMWKPGDLGERVNFAIIAKAKKIDGKATGGNSTAANVCFQIEQAFNNPYLDPITGQTQPIERCFVVSNKEIRTTAIQAIKGVLESRSYNKVTRFINGDELWQLIEQHLGERTLWEKLEQVKKMFDDADPYYRLTSTIQGDKIALSFEPKDPNIAVDHPLNLTTHFEFPDTPEGRAKRDEFENFINTGSHMTIPQEFIKEMEIPEFLRKFLEPLVNVEWQISSGTRPDPNKVALVRIEMKCDDGEVSTLDYIALLPVQSGRNQVILSNEFQRVPWRIRLKVKFDEPKINLEVQLEEKGVNVKRVLEGWRFLRAMSKGGHFRIEDLDTGFSVLQQRNEPQPFELPVPFWIDMLEKLVFIQAKTRIPIRFPDRSIPHKEMKTIYETAAILEKGKITPESVTLTGATDLGRLILDHFASGQPFNLAGSKDEVVEIFDITIPLGTVVTTIHNGYLSEENLAALKTSVDMSTSEEDSISVCFKSFPDRPIIVEYRNWLPNETSIPSHNQDK